MYSADGKTLLRYATAKSALGFDIPDTVTAIGANAFSGCTKLATVTFVTVAFLYCLKNESQICAKRKNDYKKYINTYTPEDNYYDDAFYQLGITYYESGNLAKAKETFYGLRSEVPNSMYNNSKVNEILKK